MTKHTPTWDYKVVSAIVNTKDGEFCYECSEGFKASVNALIQSIGAYHPRFSSLVLTVVRHVP